MTLTLKTKQWDFKLSLKIKSQNLSIVAKGRTLKKNEGPGGISHKSVGT